MSTVTRDARVYALELAARQLAELQAHEAGTRLGQDPEELHDMRVAARRLRTLIEAFGGLLPWTVAAQAEELRATSLVLGAVRDYDTQIQALQVLSNTGNGYAAPVDGLGAALRAKREAAQHHLLDVLSSLRYQQMIGTLDVALKCGPTEDTPGPKTREWAAAALWQAYRRFDRKARQIDAESPVEELHALRKRAKRLRYTVEFTQGLYGKSTKSISKALQPLQDLLGEHQDCVAAIPRLRDLALDESSLLSRESVLHTGVLIAEKQQRMRELRSGLPAALKRVQKAWKPLRRKL